MSEVLLAGAALKPVIDFDIGAALIFAELLLAIKEPSTQTSQPREFSA
jgi:hypothetical protein